MAQQNLVYRGKSKDVFKITGGRYKGKYRLVFTDRATGYMENGKAVFDPGRDEVVGEIPGKGAIACRFATHFFRQLQSRGIATHYIDTIGDNEMIVEPALPLSMKEAAPWLAGAAPLQNLEFTWRNNATGSFWRRYPFVRPCGNLNRLAEIWTKGDSDILVTKEALEETGALTKKETSDSVKLVKKVAQIVSDEFSARGLHVIDGKFELGRLKYGDGKIVLIDEISPDVLRVCRGYRPDKDGNCMIYRQCVETAFAGGKRTIKNKKQVAAADFIDIFL
jgi:phosphoribosylaminoimidazole-succinocarboxamide synthase